MEKKYYPRAIDSYLMDWKSDNVHKPLLSGVPGRWANHLPCVISVILSSILLR